ncbi:MAG: F0F1 ATP synthase subunit epsilon [Rhizomicrobium sp.]
MADKIAFDLVSPERLLLSDQADMVTVPGTEGYMGVMAGHSPVISTLRPGTISVQGASEGDVRFFIRGGFAEITAGKITVLAEEAIPIAELDLSLLDQRIRDAEEDVAAAKTDAERARAAESLDDLKQVRAAF